MQREMYENGHYSTVVQATGKLTIRCAQEDSITEQEKSSVII